MPANNKDVIRVADTFRNLFYTPLYVAVSGGFLYREGFDVHMTTVPEGVDSISMLKDGTVDILQSGVSRSLMDLDDGHLDFPIHIAETNQRDGFFLISRSPNDSWTWKHLENSSLIPVGFTPVPWSTLSFAMKTQGVKLNKVHVTHGLSANDAMKLFRRGEADYIQMVNPFAQELIDEGSGHLAVSIGSVLGYLCYSSLAASKSLIDSKPDTVLRFVRGFYAAQRWIVEAKTNAIADTIAPFFPGIGPDTLERSIQMYKSLRTWAEKPLIGEDGFTTMRDILIDGGLVKNQHPYEKVVQPQFALESITTYLSHC